MLHRIHRSSVSLLALSLFVLLGFGAFAEAGQSKSLTVYAYDSFVSEWGPGPKIAPLFEKKYGIKLNLVSGGDTGQLLAKAIAEKAAPKADVIVGFDSFIYDRAVAAGVLVPYASPTLSKVPESYRFARNYLTPFDYGYYVIMWDSKRLANPPKTLEDLTRPEYAKKLILMDPRTSAPGLGFLYWTRAVYGERYLDYWKRLSPSILTVTAGWDEGYGLFTSGEAPLVLSYATDPAYHLANEKTDRYKAIEFPEGHVADVEGLGIARGTKHLAEARLFIDFMLSDEAQAIIPDTNWMFPAVPTAPLPAYYSAALRPSKLLRLSAADRAAVNLKQWAITVSAAKK